MHTIERGEPVCARRGACCERNSDGKAFARSEYIGERQAVTAQQLINKHVSRINPAHGEALN